MDGQRHFDIEGVKAKGAVDQSKECHLGTGFSMRRPGRTALRDAASPTRQTRRVVLPRDRGSGTRTSDLALACTGRRLKWLWHGAEILSNDPEGNPR
jgi:hypothetical protein